MSNLTTRAGKGSPLTNNELDANFTNLNADKVEIGGDLSGTPTAPIVTKVQGQSFSSAAANVGEKLVWNGTAWAPATDPSGEPIGHADKSESSISFNAGTRTFTISPVSASFVVWCKGVKHTYTSAQTVVIPNTTGLHFIYFNASGVLSTQMTYFTWEEHAPTAYIYWNATTQQAVYFGDERHGITLDWQTHEYLHRTRGAAIANGFGASGYTTTGTGATDADAQIDIGGGTFFDEDMQVDIVSTNTPVAGTWQQDLSGPARIPVMYLSGAAWVIDSPTNFPFKVVSSVPQYNLLSGSTWSTASVTNNSYFVSWILATNNLTYPVISIISQAPTNQLSVAEAMTFEGLNLNGFPSVEFRPLYKVIYQYKDGFANSVKSSTIAVYDLRSISSAGVAAALVQDHGNLSGLGDDDHAQYLHVSEVRTPSQAVKNSLLPSQTGNSGKYLSTNGTDPVWEPIPSGSLDFTGDVTGSGNTGSSVSLTLAASGVVAGQYTKVTVDSKGRVTAGASLASADVTTALGYTPYNSTNPSGYITSSALSSYLPLSGGTLTGTVTVGTTGASSQTRALRIVPTGTNPSSFGSYTGSWRSTLEIWDNAATRMIFFAPPDGTNYNYGIIKATDAGLKIDVGSAGGTNAISIETSGIVNAPQGLQSGGNAVLHSGNYTSGYFKTINGTAITGTGDITVSGSDPTKLPLTGGQLTGQVEFRSANQLTFSDGANTMRGFIKSLANTGTGAAGLVIATSGGESIVFKDGNADSGDINFVIRGDGVLLQGGSNTLLHAGNYTSYSPSLTGSGASGTWGISITGNAATATSADQIDGWAFRNTGSNSGVNADTIDSNGITYYTGGVTNFSGNATDGALYSQRFNSDWQHQIAGDYRSGQIAIRGKNLGTWQSWRTVLDSSNYSSYALPLSGGTVSGNTTFTTSLTANTGITVNAASGAGYGINLYSGSSLQPTYGLYFAQTANFGTYGAVSADWATYFTMNSTANRGWIFREVETLGNVAAISNQGNMTLRSHFEQGNNIARPNVNWSAGSTSTGMVIFYLPGTTSNYGMVHMVFDIYEYNSNAVSTVIVGGHNWSTSWYNVSANVIGQCGKEVRLGFKDNRFCVVFGTSGSTWEYGTIVLRKIHNGSFYDNTMDMVGNWSATQTTTESFTNITGDLRALRTPSSFNAGGAITQAGNQVLHAGNYTSYSPTLTGSGASGTWSINITGSAGTLQGYQWASSGKDIRGTDIYADSWLRNYNSGTGLYNQATSNHWYSDGQYWNVGYAGTTGIRLRNGHAGTPLGYLYAETDGNFGLLNNAGAWAVRVYPSSSGGGILYGAWYGNSGLLLSSANYTSYAPSLTGSGASGTWSINVTGSAGSAPANGGTATALNSSNYISRTGSSGNLNTDFSNTPAGTMRYQGDDANITNSPGGTWWIYEHKRHSNSSNVWGTQIAWGWEDNANRLAQRNVSGGNWGGWVYYLNSANYSSYAPSLTGSGASGTWGINISGSAAQLNGYASAENGGSVVLRTASNGYLYLYNWINTGSGGIYSSVNGAHWYPNNGSYGAWKADGSRNGWGGIEFPGSSTSVSLMSEPNGDTVGWHANSYGWKFRVAGGTAYVGKNYWGGNEATVLDSSNYTNYSPSIGSTNTLTNIWYFRSNRNTTSDSPPLQAYSNDGGGAIMSFHRGGQYAVNMGLDSDNVFRIGGWSAGTNRLQMDMSGNLTMAGNVTAYSDERLKKDWSPIYDGFVDRLASILAGTYTRIDSGERQAGVSAQAMRELLPEVVSEDNEGTLALAYGNAAMVSAVELAKELVQLKRELAELKSRLH
jgi:hypothetical protein